MYYDHNAKAADIFVTDKKTGEVLFNNQMADFAPVSFSRCALGWHTQNKNGTFGKMLYDNISVELITDVSLDEHARSVLPAKFSLSQNYPNPFNSETIIRYQVTNKSWVQIKIFDLLGNEIKTLVNEEKEPGYFTTSWNGKNNNNLIVPNSVYIYQMRADAYIESKKSIILR